MSPGTVSILVALVPVAALALLAATASDSDVVDDRTRPDQKPNPATTKGDSVVEDPLPSWPLNQANIVDAIVDAIEHKREMKLTSVAVKVKSAPIGLQAYFLACLRSIPLQLREDAAYVADFKKAETERISRWRASATRKRVQELQEAASGAQKAIASLIPGLGAIVLFLWDGLAWPAIRDAVVDDFPDAEKPRSPVIYPFREGTGVSRGVSFQPRKLAYITKADRELSDKVRLEWWQARNSHAVFQTLPSVAAGTVFRFCPDWGEFLAMSKEIGADLTNPAAYL